MSTHLPGDSPMFLISIFPVLLRAHQVTGWKRPGTAFTDACWLMSFSATFHTFPLQTLSWIRRALSRYNPPFSPVKYFLSLPGKPSLFLSPNAPSSGKLACLLHSVTSVFKLYDSCFLLVTKVKLFEGHGYLDGILVSIFPHPGKALHKQTEFTNNVGKSRKSRLLEDLTPGADIKDPPSLASPGSTHPFIAC